MAGRFSTASGPCGRVGFAYRHSSSGPDISQRGASPIRWGSQMDLSASILAVAGATVPSNYEGINLFPVLEGLAPAVERTLYWRTNVGNRSMRAIRSGDW